jgi:hypothetical protein
LEGEAEPSTLGEVEKLMMKLQGMTVDEKDEVIETLLN